MGDYTLYYTTHTMKLLLAVVALSALSLAAALPADTVVPETEMSTHFDAKCDHCIDEFQKEKGCEHWKAVESGKMEHLGHLMKAIPEGCMRCKAAAHGVCNDHCDSCVASFEKEDGCEKWGKFMHAEKELHDAIPHHSCMRCAKEAEHACKNGAVVFPSFLQHHGGHKKDEDEEEMSCGKCVGEFVKREGCRKYGEMAGAEEEAKKAVPDGCARCKDDAAKVCFKKREAPLFTQMWKK